MKTLEIAFFRLVGARLVNRIKLHLEAVLGVGSGASSIKAEVNAVRSLLKIEPKLILDVGANEGLYVTELIKVFPSAKVIAFEPNKSNFNILQDKFRNKVNVKVENYAVGERNFVTKLYSDKDGSGLASLTKRNLDHYGINFEFSEEVSVICLDNYCAENDICPEFIKLDIEGHELDALKGMLKILNQVKIIQFEFGGSNVDSRTYFHDFWKILKSFQFSIYRISPIGPIEIKSYSEELERFLVSNYIAIKED